MRSGYALILAIATVVIISLVGAAIMNISSDSTKRATDDYLRLQAELLAKSATEYVLMRISGFDRSKGKCLEYVDISAEPYFDINATIWYIFDGNKPSECNNSLSETPFGTAEDNETSAIIDVVVSTKQGTTETPEPIVIHRRTLQKP